MYHGDRASYLTLEFCAKNGLTLDFLAASLAHSRLLALQLFAHNAMEEETKKVDPYDTSSGTGVLGRAKDVLQANGHVVNAINIDEAAIALDGVPGLSTPPIVVSRNGVNAFAERPDGDPWWAEPEDEMYFPIEDYAKSINGVADDFSGIFADLYSQQFVKGIQDAIDLQVDLDDAQSPLDETIWGGEPGDWDERNLWKQFRTVSKLMKTHGSRGTDRDTFYVECMYPFSSSWLLFLLLCCL